MSKRVDSLNNKKNPSPEDYDAAVPYLRLQYYLLKNGRDYRIVNLEKKMTPSQIEQAQELARNWKPKNIGNTEEIEETTVINTPRYSGEQEEY